MKSWFGFLRAQPDTGTEDPRHPRETALFAASQQSLGEEDTVMVPWETRAVEIGARRLPPAPAIALLKALWSRDRNMEQLDAHDIERMERFFHFVAIAGGRDIIRQHEYGNFMVVLLKGTIAVDRRQPWGENLRLAEARPGEILGEMSLLDSGTRFSACTSLGDCEIAALSAEGMDDMMRSEPLVAAALVALLARKLSLRLRAVNARMSDRPKQDSPHGTRSGQ